MKRHLCIAILATLTICCLAPNSTARSRNKEATPEQRHAFREWFTTTVLPTLKQWHSEYDASLSAADLATLQKLRERVKAANDEFRSQAKSLRSSSEATSKKKEALRELKDRRKQVLKDVAVQAKPIAMRSSETLESIARANATTIAQWREHVKEQLGKASKHAYMFAPDSKKAALRFILWDGTSLPDKQQRDRSYNSGGAQGADVKNRNLTIIPNPCSVVARVQITDVQAQNVLIQVVDANGTVVATHQAMVNDGNVYSTIPLENIASGHYTVRAATPSECRSAQLLVSN